MRLLLTYENLLPTAQADAEQFVNTAAALARSGHEVELVIPFDPAKGPADPDSLLQWYQVEAPLRIRQIPTGRSDGRSWGLALQHMDHARTVAADPATADYDLVYTRNLGMATACLARGHRCAYEHFRPWGDQFPPMQPWLRYVLRHPRCAAALFHSDFARRTYLRLGIPTEKLHVLHNGYEPRRLEPRVSRQQARAALDLPRDAELVVYTGRMNHKKGLDVALAMARATHRPNVRFVLVGSTGTGPLEKEAATVGNVIVRPWQTFEGVVRYLYAADVLLVPPSLDPLLVHGNTVLPIKLFSYLAAARPIFAPDSPDSSELLVHGENAFLTPPVTAAAAAAPSEALDSLLADEPLRDRLARGAANTAAELTWDKRGERLGNILCAASRDAPPEGASAAWSVKQWLRESGSWLARGLTEGRWVGRSQ